MRRGVVKVAELAKLFPGEWVLLGDPRKSRRSGEVVAGEVLAHSADRDQVYDAALMLRPARSAFLCFKDMAEGHVLVL